MDDYDKCLQRIEFSSAAHESRSNYGISCNGWTRASSVIARACDNQLNCILRRLSKANLIYSAQSFAISRTVEHVPSFCSWRPTDD